MEWPAVFLVFLVSHLVGDWILQTDFQATNKPRGLTSNGIPRRALASHAAVYTLCFVPSLVWLSDTLSTGEGLLVAALIGVPHCIQDDGRLIRAYARRIKKLDAAAHPLVLIAVDQAFHVLALFALAIAVGT
jgi:hypothetical protein